MRITLTIDIDDTNKIIVSSTEDKINTSTTEKQQPEKVEQQVEQVEQVKNAEGVIELTDEERSLIKPEGRGGRRVGPPVLSGGRTKEYPFNSGDIKSIMKQRRIKFKQLAEELGMDVIQLRNMFRWDTRRFTEQEYNVIMKAITLAEENKDIASKI